ncbi:MAG: tRNA pseudouridine synthase 1 [Pleopsidium flavum]|nr:MAG: tRNA pseudouridine synthase 1 [Pleopsidium flavum]
MGEAHDVEAPRGFQLELEEESKSKGTMAETPMDQLSSGDRRARGQKRRRESEHRDLSHSRGGGGRRNKKKDMGRAEWSRNPVNKRARNEDQQAEKRREIESGHVETPIYQVPFSKEDIQNEERKPKRKVAVMVGYSGSGYKGMQMNTKEKTIEGELFAAFVSAGAISKVNADDPKKSSLVRCARTDKGVHAAGNVISLKLIIEDKDIVQKINDNLSSQIRVWGIERTTGSFSCYQACDSRIYEYLIPTHTFVPPHPKSCLGRKLVELAKETDDAKGLEDRQEEVSSFWPATEDTYIRPVLDSLDTRTRALVEKALYESDNADQSTSTQREDQSEPHQKDGAHGKPQMEISNSPGDPSTLLKERSPLDNATRSLKAAYIAAKKAYRIHPKRLERIRSALSLYVGTRSYHNYTVQKSFRDPSAIRIIKSFVIGESPIIINDTEWLSLKVHGQSFMMHQIRKMVSMVALVVRCGCDENRILESYDNNRISIPKAPGLGLLLERPVFDTYNERAVSKFDKEKIDFAKYEKEMEEFKQREIYERIFREEEKDNQYVRELTTSLLHFLTGPDLPRFHTFFTSIDTFKSDQFLYLTSAGVSATRAAGAGPATTREVVPAAIDSDSDEDAGQDEG